MKLILSMECVYFYLRMVISVPILVYLRLVFKLINWNNRRNYVIISTSTVEPIWFFFILSHIVLLPRQSFLKPQLRHLIHLPPPVNSAGFTSGKTLTKYCFVATNLSPFFITINIPVFATLFVFKTCSKCVLFGLDITKMTLSSLI